jgi:hypothetical protein
MQKRGDGARSLDECSSRASRGGVAQPSSRWLLIAILPTGKAKIARLSKLLHIAE